MNPQVCPRRSPSIPTGVGMEARLKGTTTPRFVGLSAELSSSISILVFATFNYQWKPTESAPTALTQEIISSFSAKSGPLTYVVNGADVDSRTGLMTQAFVAWWGARDTFEAWSKEPEVELWIHGHRATGDIGYFHEIAFFPRERWESLVASSDTCPGIASLAQPEGGVCKMVHTTTHDYLGGMRDRIPLSASDPMDSPLDKLAQHNNESTRGKIIAITPPTNISIIYSGQNWEASKGDEREAYVKKLAPVLKKGMDYLNTNSLTTNCISARVLTEAEHERSVGFAFFLSLTDLEQWAWNHSTHGAIYHTFLRDYVAKSYSATKFYHEVGTIPASNLSLLYANCHESTGFLPFFEHNVIEII